MKHIILPGAIAMLALLCSCRNNSAETKDHAALSDSASVTGLTGDSVKLVKTAGLAFKVKDAEQSTRAVSSLAQKLGGMLTFQNLEAVEQGRKELKVSNDSLLVVSTTAPHAEITARIPSQNLEAFMYAVADLGYYTGSSRLQVDDRSLLYLENALKQKARNEVLSRSPVTAKSKPVAVEQTIARKDEAIAQEIANRSIDADVAYSTVSLNLLQNPVVRKEVMADTNMEVYQLPFGKRLGNALADGWEYFLKVVSTLR